MCNYRISDKEYEDGCFQGIMQILNEETKETEYYSFVFDMEMRSLSLKRRALPTWNAPICGGISDYVCEDYSYIRNYIEEEAMGY